MKIIEIEDKQRIKNPLNGGVLPPFAYDAMEVFDDIEGDLSEEIRFIKPDVDLRTRIRIVRDKINSLGKLKELPIKELVSLEPSYDPDHIKSNLKSNPPDIYLYNDVYYVNDGNHRVISAHLNGKKSIKCNVIDLDDVVKYTDVLYMKRDSGK